MQSQLWPVVIQHLLEEFAVLILSFRQIVQNLKEVQGEWTTTIKTILTLLILKNNNKNGIDISRDHDKTNSLTRSANYIHVHDTFGKYCKKRA